MDRKTELKNFIIQIESLTNMKEFRGGFIDFKNAFMFHRRVDNILLERKKSFDFAFINIMDAYSIDTTGIHNELNEMWDKCRFGDYHNYTGFTKRFLKITEYFSAGNRLAYLQEMFKMYLNLCLDLSKKKAELLINEASKDGK